MSRFILQRRSLLTGLLAAGLLPLTSMAGVASASRASLHPTASGSVATRQMSHFLQRWIVAGAQHSTLALPTLRLALKVCQADGSPAAGEVVALQGDSFLRHRGQPIVANRQPLDEHGDVELLLRFPIIAHGLTHRPPGASIDLFFLTESGLQASRLHLDPGTCQTAHCLLPSAAPRLQCPTLADRFFAEAQAPDASYPALAFDWQARHADLHIDVRLTA